MSRIVKDAPFYCVLETRYVHSVVPCESLDVAIAKSFAHKPCDSTVFCNAEFWLCYGASVNDLYWHEKG
jgi:hypothetical protein